MKLKSLLFLVCFSLFTNVFAANLHLNPNANPEDKISIAKGVMYPGYCQIEIINDSYDDVRVFGTYHDGSSIGFDIYRFEAPHYISLYYNFRCHSKMYITIQSAYSTIYSGFTSVNSTIRIVPYLNKPGLNKQDSKKQSTVEISNR
jgi:hypothetical protein